MTNRISPIFWHELRRTAREIGKRNTVRINATYFKVLRTKLGHIPARDFGNPEIKEFIKAWIAELAEQEKSRSCIQHLLITMPVTKEPLSVWSSIPFSPQN